MVVYATFDIKISCFVDWEKIVFAGKAGRGFFEKKQ